MLVTKLQEYYQVKKELLQQKRAALLNQYNASEFAQRYQELKQHLQQQQNHWQRLTAAFN
ncbi:acyl-CoA desaturase [Alishewanella longhuensis]